jgi:6-pyruvoyltetrahydropterin/6-carboxytetrahydropterin synthase
MTLEGGATTITRRLTFASGHRVMGHETKCAHLHGHNYVAEILAEADYLDSLGRVVDFSVLKNRLGGWLDEHWDHRTLLWAHDPLHAQLMLLDPEAVVAVPFNPTAENIGAHILELGNELLTSAGVRLTKVVVWETPNCRAEVVA